MELQGPLAGWTYDENGTIYTTSGYHASAQQIECALWLLGCWARESRRYLIRSDEAPGALRPPYEPADHTPAIEPTRLRLAE
ncbi:MAG TPA: hypothetical protein VIM92_08955 [Rhodanobacteraceae bacterium]